MLEKIVVPIDSIERDNTLNAIETAITISRGCRVRQEPELVFLHVLYIKEKISMSSIDRTMETKKEDIGEEFEKIGEICRERGLKEVRTILRESNPSDEIVEFAQKEDADLIAMGSGKLQDKSATGLINKFFYGSVTEDVIHKAPCSILVTRPEMDLEKVMVPVDSIEWDNTMMGVENAIEFARGCGGGRPELILMHVLHAPSDVDMNDSRIKLERERIEKEFDEIKEMCSEVGISNVSTIIKEGDPTKKKSVDQEIVETANEKDVDIVVMGSGKLQDRSTGGKFQKFVYGSVTENVLHEAPCSVMVARPLS